MSEFEETVSESEVELSDFEYDDSDAEVYEDDNENFEAIQSHTKNLKAPECKQWRLVEFIREYFLRAMDRLQIPSSAVSKEDLLVLFHYCNWDEERLVNLYYDDEKELRQKAGLLRDPIPGFQDRCDFECAICCNTSDFTKVFSLPCHHEFCLSCYCSYVKEELPKCNLIRCMVPECNLTIPHDLVHQICKQSKSSKTVTMDNLADNELLHYAANLYVRRHDDTFRWCPAVDCQNLVQMDLSARFADIELDEINPSVKSYRGSDSEVKIVTCSDGHEFCFSCRFENHLPCSCSIVRAWDRKINDDSETYRWIEVNTKGCPKCDTNIEKNGGCNHVTCFKCAYEFCWICLGIWEEHRNSYYNCNRYKATLAQEEKELKKSRKYLDRYMHFCSRFMEHQSSMAWDLKTLDAIKKTTEDYMAEKVVDATKTISYNEIDYLQESFRLLVMGRKTLKWTYAFAYYLCESNFRAIFEQNQDFLNVLVERLSELFEKIQKSETKMNLVVLLKPDLLNVSKSVTTRRLKLIEAARDYLKKGLITFDDGF